MFGYNPAVIRERVLSYTYGVRLRSLFEDGVDPVDKLVVNIKGERMCIDRFHKIAECDQVIKDNQQIKSSDTNSPSATTGFTLPLYASTTTSPRYTTDDGCFHVGTLNVNFENDVRENLKKTFRIGGYFGEPEIRILAEDIDTGERFSASFELPNK